MKRHAPIVATLACLIVVGAALAAEDSVTQRRKLMQDNGRQESKANNLILGKYFPEKAVAAMEKIAANLQAFTQLFPPGTEVGSAAGGETHALPVIWTDFGNFKALATQVAEDARAASVAATEGQDAFSLAWQKVSEGCHGCHDKYAPLSF